MFRFGDLPPEIALDILAACAKARGLERALRMRLVSKQFSRLVIDSILKSDLLQHYGRLCLYLVDKRSHITGPGSFPHIWRAYFSRLALDRGTGPATEIGVVLRASATHYCAEAGLSGGDALRAVVLALCDHKSISVWEASRFDPPPEGWPDKRHVQQGALLAATIFNNAAVAERLLACGRDLAVFDDWLPGCHFRPPAYLAVYHGSHDVARVFSQMSSGVREGYRHSGIVSACAASGSPENLEAFWGEAPLERVDVGDPRLLRNITSDALSDLCYSGNPDAIELYRKLSFERRGLSAPAPLEDMSESERYHITWRLYRPSRQWVDEAAYRGDIQMLKYLLEIVFPLHQYPRNLSMAEAAGAFQTDAVKWLLQHGASVTKGHPLQKAAAAGSFEISKILIENGADVHAGKVPPISCAVRMEHTGLVNLLVKNGALTRKGRKKALQVADECGLDSMAELIQSYSKTARKG